jgi:hypothetical protein
MNAARILFILQIMCLVSFATGMITTSTAAQSKDACPDPLQVADAQARKEAIDQSGDVLLIDEEDQKEADSLAGTCPKGFCCSCASCPLYSDLDEDVFCDLGEEPEV